MSHTPEGGKPPLHMPAEPIDKLVAPISRFMHIETASGIVLLGATIVALVLANSRFSEGFLGFWETHIGFSIGEYHLDHSLQHWINDALMALFFFVVGLEVKREFVFGQLRDIRQAVLPIVGALGGMAAPALVYLIFQHDGEARHGWGIPMATDIAFVVGCMIILGPKVPPGLRVMMLTLAIADDIGAILVIALGYSSGVNFAALAVGFALIAAISGLTRLGVRSILVYAALGVAVWFAFYESGVHATIAGVIIGLMTPARAYLSTTFFGEALTRAQEIIAGDWESSPDRAGRVLRFQRATREMVSPLEYLEAVLHPWVAFLIMPVFALANAGVPVKVSELGNPVAIAVAAGLLLGKPLGIVSFSWLAVRLGIARLPQGVTWPVLLGGGILGGIGFTMALFVAGLAVKGESLDAAKIGILMGSALAAALGMTWLTIVSKPGKAVASDDASQA